MSIKNFIIDILNVDSDIIDTIYSVKMPDESLNIYITLRKDPQLCCPYCKGPIISNGYTKRKLIHSTLANRKCTIIFKRKRFICKDCCISFSENNPFSFKGESLTYETKINILKDLKDCHQTYTCVAKRYNVSVTEVIRVFDKHVSIPRKPLPTVLSIDEHYFPNSDFDSIFFCLLMDFETGTIIDVLPDRKKKYLSHYFSTISNSTLDLNTNTSELSNVKYISIDLWDTYKEIAQTYFPFATICADSFHVLENLTKCFKDVRMHFYNSTEDKNLKYLLVKFRYVFNHGEDLDNEQKYNKRFKRFLNKRDIINIMFDSFPDLKKAYELKEDYINFNANTSKDEAKEKLADMIEQFSKSGITQYESFTNLLINWNKEIINSFSIVNNRRINNSYIESRNSNIELLLYNSNGFTNFKRTRNRIIYCLNNKDSYTI